MGIETENGENFMEAAHNCVCVLCIVCVCVYDILSVHIFIHLDPAIPPMGLPHESKSILPLSHQKTNNPETYLTTRREAYYSRVQTKGNIRDYV